jgi:hypothetical protein
MELGLSPVSAGASRSRRFVANPLLDPSANGETISSMGFTSPPFHHNKRRGQMSAAAWKREAEENSAECERLQQAMQEVMVRTENVVGHLQDELATSQDEAAAAAQRIADLEERLKDVEDVTAAELEAANADAKLQTQTANAEMQEHAERAKQKVKLAEAAAWEWAADNASKVRQDADNRVSALEAARTAAEENEVVRQKAEAEAKKQVQLQLMKSIVRRMRQGLLERVWSGWLDTVRESHESGQLKAAAEAARAMQERCAKEAEEKIAAFRGECDKKIAAMEQVNRTVGHEAF